MESEEGSEEEREEERIQRKVFHVRKANDDQWNHGKSVEVVECNGKVVNQWEVVRGVKVVEDVKHVIRPKCKESFHNVACCICSPDCPKDMTDIGFYFKKEVSLERRKKILVWD